MVRTKKCFLLSVFNCLISFVASIQKIEIETISSFPIQRSQLRNGETTVLQNFYDIQYYTFINMGTPGQTQKVLLDTGSGLLWVPAVNCSNCASQALKFNSSQSQTFTDLNQKHKIQYLKGEANGIMGEDFVTFQNFKVYAKFMLAEQEADLGGSKFDGIMGLSNDHSYKNVFQIGYRENLLVSSTFAFQLGLRYLKKKSYFYYNITKQDFPNAYFIPTSRKNKWMIPIKGIHVNNVRYNVSQVLIDTGTSLTLLPPKQYDQLENDVFSRFCFPSTSNYAYIQDVGLRYCSCKFVDYPNITFVTSGISFNLTPTMYIFGLSQGSQKCYLGIENSQTSMAILGDNFLQHNTVIFNKQTQEIGFIGNYNQLFQYIDSSDILTTLTVVWIMMVVAIIGMLCWLQEEENTTSLRQSLTVPENKIKQTIQVM